MKRQDATNPSNFIKTGSFPRSW